MTNPFTTILRVQNGPSQGHTQNGSFQNHPQNSPSQGYTKPGFSDNNQDLLHLNKPALTVISINIEGFSDNKALLLGELCRESKCDVLCVQETHRGEPQLRPHIPGMTLVLEIPHHKYGSAIFVKTGIKIVSASSTNHDSIEILTIDTGNCTITSIYKPPNQPFKFNCTDNFYDRDLKIVTGDFNSHSTTWGYQETNTDGSSVEQWAETENLSLLHDPKLPPSFNSGRWKRGYNPDLLFVSNKIRSLCSKFVCNPVPKTQHRPISCIIQAALKPVKVPFRRRFNFAKADWKLFADKVDKELINLKLEPKPQNYEQFTKVIWTSSREHIPRGCRSLYIPGLKQDSAKLLKTYSDLYATDPFSENTLNTGEELMNRLSEVRREKWVQTVSKIDMTHNSKKAWSTLRKLTDSPAEPTNPGKVTANQVAHQLLLNGKTPLRLPKTPKISKLANNTTDLSDPFLISDIIPAIKLLKNGKAAGLDDICVEQIKNLGPVAISWLLELFNSCMESAKLPKIWRKAKVIALLKPGKPPTDPKSYRPISLLCHTYKLFERMLLERITPKIDPKLIPEQAGFRPGKSCAGQTLRLVQHIEDGYESNKITGVALVDLSAAYDTVNIKKLLFKVFDITKDQRLTLILGEMLRNRRFQVFLGSGKSRWRSQKNGLPQGSVLAPILFNIYTNDQPNPPDTVRFLYADDLALAVQTHTFEDAEIKLNNALNTLSTYYDQNALRPNPSKTQTCAFHLRNRDANRQLNILWRGTNVLHCDKPVYLGVTLDRTLSYKYHCHKTKMKIESRNNLLRRLTSTSWGAAPHVLRTTGLALCFSAGEFACPVWHRSTHAKEVDVALNETCRTITGCLKPTPLSKLYPLAGIAPPAVRRDVACAAEKFRQEHDKRHPMFNMQLSKSRLKSRKSFLKYTTALTKHPTDARVELWQKMYVLSNDYVAPAEELPPGHKESWPTWKSLNRLRTQVGRSQDNMAKWGYIPCDMECLCGTRPQTMEHLLDCPSCPDSCSLSDLMEATESAISVAAFWSKHQI